MIRKRSRQQDVAGGLKFWGPSMQRSVNLSNRIKLGTSAIPYASWRLLVSGRGQFLCFFFRQNSKHLDAELAFMR
jgi:hypothetical protein